MMMTRLPLDIRPQLECVRTNLALAKKSQDCKQQQQQQQQQLTTNNQQPTTNNQQPTTNN